MIGWGAETMLAVSALLAVVLLLRRPVAAIAGAGWAYALWLLPLLRIVTPPLSAELPSPLPPITVDLAGSAGTAASLPPSGGPGQWVPILLALWAGGAAVFAIWQVLRYRRFAARIEATLRPSYPDQHGGIPLLESRAVEGPIAVGLTRPPHHPAL